MHSSTSTGGVLNINVVYGSLTRDVEAFGKQYPYVKIVYQGVKYKTRVHENGGKTPVWN
jgi:hypothetical protein